MTAKASPPPIGIRRARASDLEGWLRLRALLWPSSHPREHRTEMTEYLAGKDRVAFIAAARPGMVAGFVEATIRPFAECCDTRPVGYIEGWYVDADVRQQGVGKRLVLAAERWAQRSGCSEMGSDCLVENSTSLVAHRAIGYEEREHLIHFRKWLKRPRRR